MSKLIFITLLLSFSRLVAQNAVPPEILEAENGELKMVIDSLRAENKLLKSRNDQLIQDVLNLGHQIRALKKQVPKKEPTIVVPSAASSAHVAPSPSPEKVENEMYAAPETQVQHYQVVYVNPTWHYLIINAGSNSGIHSGDIGSVIRDGQRIAHIKVNDTKDNQLVADLELKSMSASGVYPRKSDIVTFP